VHCSTCGSAQLQQSPYDTLSVLQGQERQSPAGSQQFSAGKEQMQGFCYATGCRHAALIAHFEPGGVLPAGPCKCASTSIDLNLVQPSSPRHPAGEGRARCTRRGGCDNCARRAAGEDAERDLGEEAGLLLAAVAALRGHYGAAKPVALLRGSRGKDMPPWMLEATAANGVRLHGVPLPQLFGLQAGQGPNLQLELEKDFMEYDVICAISLS